MKIMLGEYFVFDSGMLFVIVFGLCVVVCICDIDVGIGGMNYFMLFDEGGWDILSFLVCYGIYVMEVLIN